MSDSITNERIIAEVTVYLSYKFYYALEFKL
jgi:hypothetical protein